MNAVYLKTDGKAFEAEEKFFKVKENGKANIVTINLTKNTIKHTKGIASSPYGVRPCKATEFDEARKKVLKHLSQL